MKKNAFFLYLGLNQSIKYNVKALEKIYSMMMLSKTLFLTSNMVYVNEKAFNRNDILYIVEKVLKKDNLYEYK